DTRRDYHVQRRRADAALEWALARYRQRGGRLPAPPDPEGPRDEIGYYMVGSLSAKPRRGDWSDEQHGAMIGLLEQLIEIDRMPALGAALLSDLLEQTAEPLEHRRGHHEFVLAERLQCGAEARLE